MSNAVIDSDRFRELNHDAEQRSNVYVRLFPYENNYAFAYYFICPTKQYHYQSKPKRYPRFPNDKEEMIFVEILFEEIISNPYNIETSIERYINSIHSKATRRYEHLF